MTKTFWMDRPVVVTGGASFIGSHLVEALVACGAKVHVVDDLSTGRLDHLDAVLTDPSISGVLILTPPNTHLELVERCAAAGKAVLLEKPLDITIERARRIVEVMEAAGLPLQVMLQFRFRAVSRRLRAILASGELLGLVLAWRRVLHWAFRVEMGQALFGAL